MKNLSVKFLLPVAGTAFLSACGDDVTKVYMENQVGVGQVASFGEFPKCTVENIGEMLYVTDSAKVYYCADSTWVTLNGKDGEKGSDCTADSTAKGIVVVCGGDTVGTIVNGKDGENGADGDGCTITDNGDGSISQICGMDTVLSYKALCGNKAYGPEEAFCAGDSLYSCAGKPFNPAEKFCDEESVYDLCGGMTYDPMDTSWKCYGRKLIGQFTDSRDNQTYSAVKIGEQVWMAENLNYAYLVKTADLDSSSFCYNDSAAYCETYGRLYTWSAAMDSAAVFSDDGKGCGVLSECSASEQVRGVCPDGWHFPSDNEWKTLERFVAKSLFDGSTDSVGYALKSTSGWRWNVFQGVSGNGSDAFGFGVLPAGCNTVGGFYSVLGEACFHSSTVKYGNPYNISGLYLSYDQTNLSVVEPGRQARLSVRCVKD